MESWRQREVSMMSPLNITPLMARQGYLSSWRISSPGIPCAGSIAVSSLAAGEQPTEQENSISSPVDCLNPIRDERFGVHGYKMFCADVVSATLWNSSRKLPIWGDPDAGQKVVVFNFSIVTPRSPWNQSCPGLHSTRIVSRFGSATGGSDVGSCITVQSWRSFGSLENLACIFSQWGVH